MKNFRNLACADIPLSPGTVVVGENQAGKTNLIHAVRLVMDAALPNSERYLRREDFWEGLATTPDFDPMESLAEIEISVEITEFDHEVEIVAALADALIEGDPMKARLTYIYRPRAVPEGEPPGSAGYEWRIFGGSNEDAIVAGDMRGTLHTVYLGALRDVTADLGSWRRSPLRALLEAAGEDTDPDDLNQVAAAIAEANSAVSGLTSVKDIAIALSNLMREIAGEQHGLQTELGIAPVDPRKLLRGLRLFVGDAVRRPLEMSSLGTLNVLYLALLELRLAQRLKTSEIAHVILAIEEPEAHLHPHLQRVIFRRLLRESEPGRSVLVTTQSPHIAAVADPKHLVVLRRQETQSIPSAAARADLEDREWADIERYLDATRAELVFAQRVLLVEGYAEQVMVPALGGQYGFDLDKLGISVCAIHGTHFSSYVRFLDALSVPWALVTDGDVNTAGQSRGERRAESLMTLLGKGGEFWRHGIFVGQTTFEYNLYGQSGSNRSAFLSTLTDLTLSTAAQTRLEAWSGTVPTYDMFMKALTDAGGKGRVAHRLARERLEAPHYVLGALWYLAHQ